MNIESIIGDYKTFLDKIFSNLEGAGFEMDEFRELDHLGYRVESLERYYELKSKFSGFSESMMDKEFAGRPVLVCKLKAPFIYEEFKIEGIEVLAPKVNNKFKEGLEHAEFVTKITLAEFFEKHEDIKFNLDTYSREENPELILEFGDCAVKFHEQSLLKVRGM
jgi:predicted metalloenzyme YecM